MKTLLTILFLVWATSAQAIPLIDENYEVTAGSLDAGTTRTEMLARGWTTTCASSPCTMDIVTSPVHGGSKALRMTYDGLHCPAGCDDTKNSKLTFDYTDSTEVWGRYYVRYERIVAGTVANFVTALNASAKQHYLNPGGGDPIVSVIYGMYFNAGVTNTPAFDSQINGYTVPCRGGASSTTCIWLTNQASVTVPIRTSPTDNPGSWQCMEYHAKLNTPGAADGVLETWIDGVLTSRWTTVLLRNAANASLLRTIQVYRQGADNMYRYEDDFVLQDGADGRVGCSGTPPPVGDTTPPTPPTSVTVQ